MSIASLAKSSSAGLPLALDRLSNHNNNNNTQHHNNNNSKELQIRQHHLTQNSTKTNQVGTVVLYGVPIVSLVIDQTERLCLAQISNTLLKAFSYNEIHNRRVALGITCVQCTPVQLEILRRAGAMPVSSRRCGMITRREAERLCKSFLGDNSPPRLPDDFAFAVHHECAWGCRGSFLPARYNSSRAKCIKCSVCGLFFSPNKFIFHSHRTGPGARYVQPDAANFNSWRRHMRLSGSPPEEIVHAWEDVKAMFNGGTRKRLLTTGGPGHTSHSSSEPQCKTSPPHLVISTGASGGSSMSQKAPSQHEVMSHHHHHHQGVPPFPLAAPTRVPPLPLVMDYVWHHTGIYPGIKPYCLPWLTPSPLLIPPPTPSAVNMTTSINNNNNHIPLSEKHAVHQQHASAFRPVINTTTTAPSRCIVGSSQLPPPPPIITTARTSPHIGDVSKSPLERSPLSSPRSRSDCNEDDDYIDEEMSNTKVIPEVDGVDRERSSGGSNEDRLEGVEMSGVEANEEEDDDEETVDIETCPEDEVKPNPCWTEVTPFDNEKKYQILSQGSESAEKQDNMECEADRKCLPFPWSEAFLHERQRQLIRPHSHLMREKLSFQPEVNVNGNDVTLPVDCTTCHQITADIYTSPAIKHQ